MFDLFSDIFARRDNALSRIDTRVKLVIALSAIIVVMFSTRVFLPLGICVVCLSTMLAVGLPLRIVFLRLAGPLGIAVVLVILQAFFSKGTPVLQFTIFNTDVAATREGLWKGTLLASRVLGSMSAVLLLGAVTPRTKCFMPSDGSASRKAGLRLPSWCIDTHSYSWTGRPTWLKRNGFASGIPASSALSIRSEFWPALSSLSLWIRQCERMRRWY